MDIYNSSGFQWWCKQQRKNIYIAIVFLIFFLVIFCSALFSNLNLSKMSSETIDPFAIVILVFMIIVFIVIILSFLKTIRRNMKIKVDECWYGTVVNYYVKRYGSANNRRTRLYIVVDVNGKQMDARCMRQTYRKAQQGQKIIVFTIKGKEHLYCVHPEM